MSSPFWFPHPLMLLSPVCGAIGISWLVPMAGALLQSRPAAATAASAASPPGLPSSEP